MTKRDEIKVTLRRSAIGYSKKQKVTLESLGLRRLNRSRTFKDTPSIRGMIRKVEHLVEVEEV